MMRVFIFLWQIGALIIKAMAMRYPNEIAELPQVHCDQDRIMVKIKTTLSNPSHIYAENFHDNANCVARNLNRISIAHGQCGMLAERMSGPNGMMQRVCIAVQLHPLFVTEADRSYCAQCVYVENGLVNELQRTLGISDSRPSELTPRFEDLLAVKPKCTYTIRRGAVDGPEIHYATIGESVFHVWECNSGAVGILVQNCFVEDGQGNKILIIDKNGCGVDQYVLATPTYSNGLNVAYQPPHDCPNPNARPSGVGGGDSSGNTLWPPAVSPESGSYSGNGPQATAAAAAPALSVNRPLQPPSRQPPPRLARNGAVQTSAVYHGSKGGKLAAPNGTEVIDQSAVRQRRQHVLDEDDEAAALLYPATEVVGVLRVLDTPEDANYFEHKMLRNSKTDNQRCLATATYFTLIVITLLFAISQAVFVAYYLSNRCGTR